MSSMMHPRRRWTYHGRAFAAGLCSASLLALPALAEVRVSGGRMAPVERGVEVEAPDTASPKGDGESETRLRVGEIERSTAPEGIENRLDIGTLTQQAEGEDAVSKTIIGIIEDVEASGSITNQVTIGTSTDIAIGAGARACSEIGMIGSAGCR